MKQNILNVEKICAKFLELSKRECTVTTIKNKNAAECQEKLKTDPKSNFLVLLY